MPSEKKQKGRQGMRRLKMAITRILFFAVTLVKINDIDASCFNSPAALSVDQIEEVRAAGQLDMSWSFGEKSESHFRFVTSENEVYLELFLVGKALSLLSEETLATLKTASTDSGEEFSYFTYVLKNDEQEFLDVPLLSKVHASPDSSSYLVHERRVLNQEPTVVDRSFLRQSILSGRVAIYTGAGISAAAGVPTMGQLNDLLDFEEGEGFLKSLERIVQAPLITTRSARLFHNACFTSNDTPAHRAIALLSNMYEIPVITENIDCLHEVSGIQPYRINANEIRQEVSPYEACAIDWIVCVGLSHDDKGFLGWYKYVNPKGKILAVDIKQPSYLGSEDSILYSDLQTVLPSLGSVEVVK
jgi:hypothetical protein